MNRLCISFFSFLFYLHYLHELCGLVHLWNKPSRKRPSDKWYIHLIDILTWIDKHVTPALLNNAIWCKAKKNYFSDQSQSKNENKLYWTDNTLVSFSFYFMYFIFVICVDLFTCETNPTENDFRQMIHPFG